MGKSTVFAMFNSYVKLPKGKTFLWNPTQKSCMIDFFVSGITTDIYTLTVEDDFKLVFGKDDFWQILKF